MLNFIINLGNRHGNRYHTDSEIRLILHFRFWILPDYFDVDLVVFGLIFALGKGFRIAAFFAFLEGHVLAPVVEAFA